MTKVFIAIDIGASSGRLMKSDYQDGKISLTEVHRFKNGFQYESGCDRWQIDYLIEEILIGLAKVKKQGVNQCFVGIDTWGVDYCLVDAYGERLANPVAYRDARTKKALDRFQEKMPLQKLYEKTGIQIQPFNTLFQLLLEDPELLKQADKLLLIPDYLGYVFTGHMVTEKTNASTMQLLNVTTEKWDVDLLSLLQIKTSLFPPLVDSGTILGSLQREQFPAYELPEVTFITVASHDTASAVIGTPAQGTDWAYISSGTWSLLGVETQAPIVSQEAFTENYTNEWGAQGTIRFLKNIMGMWLIQEVARSQREAYTFPELAQLAADVPPFQQFIDVNDPCFLKPENMIQAIQEYCAKSGQKIPTTSGELARCIYDNLALCYAVELEKLTDLTGKKQVFDTLYIVGGGSNNHLLNQLTADSGKIVVQAGPSEATALGNIVLQMVTVGEFSSIAAGRMCLKHSFPSRTYQPQAVPAAIFSEYKNFLKGVF